MATSSSDTESDASSGSDYTYIMPDGGVGAVEKLTKAEMAHMYAQQMKSMVASYECFINEMQELSLRPTGVTKKRGVHTHGTGGGGPGVRVQGGSNFGDGRRELITTNTTLESSRGTNAAERSSTPTSYNPRKPCCSHNDVLSKKVDALCSFVQTVFTSQVQLLGKCYQDQMEMRQRVDELKLVSEEYDEELEYMEKELLVMKKGINDMKVFTSKSVDQKTKIILNEMKEFFIGIHDQTKLLSERVDDLLGTIQKKRSTTTPSGSGSNSDIENDGNKESTSQEPLNITDNLGLD